MSDARPARSLRSRIFLSFLAVVVPLLVLVVASIELVLVPHVKEDMWAELENATRVIAKAVDDSGSVAIRQHLKGIAEKHRVIARQRMELVERGLITRGEAIARLREVFLRQTVGSSGYVYCLDSSGNVPVHPKPAVEGTNQAEYDFVREQMQRREGYLEYDWRNPGEAAPRPKALYMVYFEPLDWIISASSYRSEFDELLDPADFRETVLSLRFHQSGYSYVINEQGDVLIHPVLREFNALTQTGVEADFVDDMLRAGSGRIEYRWQNPAETRPRRKMAVYDSVPAYDWVVVSTAYTGEVMKPIWIIRGTAYGAVLLLLAAGGTLSYLFSRRLTRPVEAMIAQLDHNARNGAHDPLPEDGSRELARLAREVNIFMAAVDERTRQLNEQRQRYQSLFETSPNGIFVFRDSRIIDCNPAGEAMLGASRGQLVGIDPVEISPPMQPDGTDSASGARAHLRSALKDGTTSFEWVHYRMDGTPFHAEITLRVFGTEGGEPLLVSFVRDVTERKQAEAAIRRERDFSQALVDASPAYILILDPGHRIRVVNPALCEALGYTREQMIGQDYFDLVIPAEDRDRLRQAIERIREAARHGDSATTTGTNRALARDGTAHWVLWSGTWLRDYGGGEEGLLAVGVDVTEERSLQEQLHHAQKLEALGRLAGGVAHDLNNMLGGILNAAELIALRMPDDDPMHDHVRLIADTVERAAELAGRLLAFSRKGKSASTPVDLHELLEAALKIFTSGMDPRIEVQSALDAEHPVLVGDPSQLQNVLLNLFINARDAMPAGGTLRIETRNIRLDDDACEASAFPLEPGPHLEVVVADTGHGMDQATRAKVFEPFFTTKEEGKGTGLGLSSAFGVVTAHRGEIRVESEPGTGTRFTMRLPCADSTVRPAAQTETELPRGSGTVLLVEDDEVMRTTARLMLEELGYDVISARDGQEAVERYREDPAAIDAVLLDMVMPRMSGRDTFLAIRAIDPQARVLLASGFSDQSTIQDLRAEGLLGFVEKPYRLAALGRALRQAFDAASEG
jgi:PAS domain S-box-containing protein